MKGLAKEETIVISGAFSALCEVRQNLWNRPNNRKKCNQWVFKISWNLFLPQILTQSFEFLFSVRTLLNIVLPAVGESFDGWDKTISKFLEI